MNLYRECAICNNKNGNLLYEQKFILPDEYKGLPEKYNIVECTCCGLVYNDMKASQAVYDSYYAKNSNYYERNFVNQNLPSSVARITEKDIIRFENVLDDVSVFINHESQILDIGCANGGFLYVLKSNGYRNVVGIDMSEECLSNAKGLDIECHKAGCFTMPDTFENKFDLVVLSHVLEHIYDVDIAIKNISRVMKDGGVLYIESPDSSRYYDFYNKPFYFFDLEHINHFNEQSLINLAGKHGFTVEVSNEKKAGNGYPSVSIIFKKNNSPHLNVLSDNSKLKKYIEKSHENDIVDKIRELIISQEEVIAWGVGNIALSLLGKGLNECNIVAVVDSDIKKQGITFSALNGLKVENPEVIKNFKGATIVILAAYYHEEISKQIKDMDTSNRIKSIF